ncbi:MAG: hypothetical protein KBT27_06815 [Prevotellaceae bacterium]|nr:hypothetical protein [Candidatus Faecinaster equi]
MNVNKNKHHSAWGLSALKPYSVLSVRKYIFDIHPEYDLTYFISYSRKMELNLPTLLAINQIKKNVYCCCKQLVYFSFAYYGYHRLPARCIG